MANEIPPGVVLEGEEETPAQAQPTPQPEAPQPQPQPQPATTPQEQPAPATAQPAPQPTPQRAAQPEQPAPPRGMAGTYQSPWAKPTPQSEAPQPQPTAQPEADQTDQPPVENVELPQEIADLLFTDTAPAAPAQPAPAQPAPAQPAPAQPETPSTPEAKYADDEAKMFAAYLQQGGSVADITAYQQATQAEDVSDVDLIRADVRRQFPDANDEAIEGFLRTQYGEYAPRKEVGPDGKEKLIPADQVANMRIGQRAKEIREANQAIVQKIQAAGQPQAPEQPASRSDAPATPEAPTGQTPISEEVTRRVARQAIQQANLSMKLDGAGLAADFTVSLPEPQQQVLEQSVAAYFTQLVAHHGGLNAKTAPQIYKDVRDNARNMAIALNAEQVVKSAFASGVNAARQEQARKTAGPPPRTAQGGQSPNAGQTVDYARDQAALLKKRMAGIQS